MWCSSSRIIAGFAALAVLFGTARPINAEIIQQYDDTTGSGSATFSSNVAVTPAGGIPFSNTYVDNGGMNVEGQSVVLPSAKGFQYSISQFNFYTGGSTAATGNVPAGSGTPMGYAPANTTLYVFEDDTSEKVGNTNGGAYTGSPTSLSPSLTSMSPGVAAGATLVGYSQTVGSTDAKAYLFTPTGPNSLVLTTGNTYFFYVGYTTSPPPSFNFDATNVTFGTKYNTPYSSGTDTGDQRYRAPSGGAAPGNFGGPLNQMTLFELDATVPEPSRFAGMVGMGVMGAIGLCFGFARNRKPAIW